jgi:hypothetical protein
LPNFLAATVLQKETDAYDPRTDPYCPKIKLFSPLLIKLVSYRFRKNYGASNFSLSVVFPQFARLGNPKILRFTSNTFAHILGFSVE